MDGITFFGSIRSWLADTSLAGDIRIGSEQVELDSLGYEV